MISRSLYGFLAFSIVICVFGKVSFGRSSEPDREMEQVTYLGVRTESLAPAMSKQLSLPMGLHLSVVRVGPDSPAEKAGLREFDVLLKLDEQILVNEDQLKKLVRLQRPQDPITLKVLREGKLLDVVVVLEETQVPKETYSSSRNPLMYDRSNRPMRNPFFDDELLKDFWDDRFEDFIMKDPNFGLRNNRFFPQVRPKSHKGQPKVLGDPEDPLHQPGGDVQSFSYSSSQSQKVVTDEEGTLEWTEKDGQKFLRATDSSGNLLFEGPVNTEEDWSKVPKKLSQKLKKSGIRF